jgi:cytochrome P450
LDEDTIIFFRDIIRESMKLRKESKTRRNDLVDLVLDALSDAKKEVKEVENDQFEKDAAIKPSGTVEISESDMETYLVANSLLLFIAGFDTSSTIMSMCMYFMAKNPTVQEKLYEEIKEAVEKAGTQSLDYYTVQSLPYLDMFLNETLRMYPLTHLERVCVRDYKIPGTNFTIPKGMLVQVPSGAIMKDEKFFSDPLSFDPEHFSAESKAERTPYAFLAFGQGPRNCIGMRFALLQIKIALTRLVANFKVVATSRTPEKAIPDPMSQSGQPRGGVWLSVEKRSKWS